MIPEVSAWRSAEALLGAATAKVQVGCSAANKRPGDSVSAAVQNREPDHWFMIPARLRSHQGPNGAKPPWVCRNILARRFSGSSGVMSALRAAKGPSAADLKLLHRKRQARPGTSSRKAGLESEIYQCPLFSEVRTRGAATYYELWKTGTRAPDRTTAMEEKNPALDAGFGCAHRFDAVLVRQGRARTLRAILDLHGPLLCRPLETLGFHRTVFRSRHHRARRPDPDAGAGGSGISRARPRRLAEKIRSRGVTFPSLRQSDRQPGHQAQ